mmetsp:Transcript_29326/g.51346  ORF Transcript_29326/g.51346 Transcript_29326/m.51346 type:complete len:514 (-) Transcript_29326:63-1604(-)
MVSVIRQTSMPSMVPAAVASAAPWPRPASLLEPRMVTSSTAASLSGAASPPAASPVALPLSTGSSMTLGVSSVRPTPTVATTTQRPGSASTVGASSVVRQHSAACVERQQSAAGLYQQQRTVSFLPEASAGGEKVAHLLSADIASISAPATARGSSPTRLISAPASTIGNMVLPNALQAIRTPPVPYHPSALRVDGIPHTARGTYRADGALLSHRGQIPVDSYRGDGAVHSYPGPGYIHQSHAGNVAWGNGVGVTGNVTLAAHASNLLQSPRGRGDSPVRTAFPMPDQGSRSNSPRRTSSNPRMKRQQMQTDRAPERAQRLYEDAVARRERLREKKQQKERQQQQALEEGQRNFATRQRENQRFYRFRDSRTHEEREEAMLRRRDERVRELRREKKQKELEKYSECTFQPHFFTRGRENRQARGDVRASSCGAIVGNAEHEHRFVNDTPRNHLRPSFAENVEEAFEDEGNPTDEEYLESPGRRAASQLHSLPESDMDVTLSSANGGGYLSSEA